MSRPTLKTPALIDEICRRLAGIDGPVEDLAVICRDAHMPNVKTVRDWRKDDAELDERIAQAYLDGNEGIQHEILEIVDHPKPGVIEEYERQAKPRAADAPADAPIEYELVLVKRKTEDMLGHRKLQAYHREQRLTRRQPASVQRVLHGNLDGTNLAPPTFVLQPVQPVPTPQDDS